MNTTIDYAELHDFCLAWMMGYDSMNIMVGWFNELGWDYSTFECEARTMNWFVASMAQLKSFHQDQSENK